MFLSFIKLYQLLYRKKLRTIGKILALLWRVLFACDIPASCVLGKKINFPHYGLGVVIHPRSKIGDNCKIYQHVTIGSRNGSNPPILGENILIGAGASILGNITIGDNVQIGANSVVLKDVPNNATVVGIPGKITNYQKSDF